MAKKLGSCGPKGYYTEKGNPPKRFYLGYDLEQAERRKVRLEEFCDSMKDYQWTPFSLFLAKAIAKGQTEVEVDDWISGSPHALTNLQNDYPSIRLVVNDAKVHEEQEKEAKKLEAEATTYRFNGKNNSQTLYQALDAFEKWIRGKFIKPNGYLKPNGKRLIGNIKTWKNHQENMPLAQFTLKAIESSEDYWEARPMLKRGTIASITCAEEQIKLVRKFIRWLHKSEDFAWRLPADYMVRRMSIKPTREELATKANPEQVKRWKIADLKILWETASPLQRLLICLGMNCGFGAAEVKSLCLDEIQGDFIKRIRDKTLVYGEWQLWDITKQAIDWYVKHKRPASEKLQLILTKNGNALESTEKGNNNPTINNWWYALVRKVKVDHPDFRQLPFNKLRKTSGNLIRKIAGGETMAIFHARGKPVPTDEHSEVYSNKNFARVFKAIRIMGKKLAGVFTGVENPFPAQPTKPHFTPGKVKRVKELRNQGLQIWKIAEEMKCSDETIRKYLRQK